MTQWHSKKYQQVILLKKRTRRIIRVLFSRVSDIVGIHYRLKNGLSSIILA